eukprot:SAG31_NODE_438_length_15693_cov_6.254248_15_plen_289_part_00
MHLADAQPVVKKKMEGFGGGSGFQAGQDEFRNAPAGGGSVGGSGGAGNFDARTQQGGIMGKALGIAQAAKNQAQSFAEQNQYAAKAMQMGQQVAGAVGVPGMGTQQANAYQSADGATQQPQFGQPQFGQPQFGAPGGFNMPGNETQVQAPAGSFGEGGMPQQPQASAMPKRIKVEAGEYEAKIIDDLCEPSGARPNPSKEVLNNFVKQCGTQHSMRKKQNKRRCHLRITRSVIDFVEFIWLKFVHRLARCQFGLRTPRREIGGRRLESCAESTGRHRGLGNHEEGWCG